MRVYVLLCVVSACIVVCVRACVRACAFLCRKLVIGQSQETMFGSPLPIGYTIPKM